MNTCIRILTALIYTMLALFLIFMLWGGRL